MLVVTFREMWARRRRFAGMAVAIVIGVAFLSGTLALNDTLRTNFDSMFAAANAGTDAVVRSSTTTGEGNAVQRATFPASVLDRVRTLPGVADAQPYVEEWGEILGADGKAVGGNGPPRLAGNWIGDQALTGYRIAEGRAPQADGEVVINRGAAKSGNLHVGDTTTVLTPDPVHVRIVGIATFGDSDGFGPETFVAFTLHQAQQQLLHRTDVYTQIRVRAQPGVSQSDLVARIRPVLPRGVETITGTQLTADNLDEVSTQFLNFLEGFLVIFAGIALLVATLVIHNAFAVLAAQRLRETALLRALGATRRQVLGGLTVESLTVGAVAGGLGLLGGIGIATLLKVMFDAFGFSLPSGGLSITAGSLLLAFAVGVAATLFSVLAPALSASRVPPIAAMRDVATERAGTSRARLIVGGVSALAGIGALALAAPISGRLVIAGAGALLAIVGVIAVGPLVAPSAVRAAGTPVQRLRGIVGGLARQNAMRSPKRTSGTAAALMVGIAVASVLAAVAGSVRATAQDGLARSLHADVVVATGAYGGGGLGAKLVDDVARLPQVRTAVGLGGGSIKVAGNDERTSIIEPAQLGGLVDIGVSRGSLDALGTKGIAVSDNTASSNGWQVGSRVPVVFPDATSTSLDVVATYRETSLVGNYVLGTGSWSQHSLQTLDSAVLVALRRGADVNAAISTIEGVATPYGRPDVLDRQGFIDSRLAFFATMLGLVDVMLVLAIIIAGLGIAATMSLAVSERVHEIGLLRALGATATQVRSLIRWESVIVAIVGTATGVALGLLTGWALVRASATASTPTTFSVPLSQLIPIATVGGAVGVIAAIRPARRAARIDVLRAVTTE